MKVAAALRRMLAAGLSIDQALTAVEAFELEGIASGNELTKRQARNKRYYENKKASEKRLNQDELDSLDEVETPSSPEGSSPKPLSPKPLQPSPPSPPKGGSSPIEEAIRIFSEEASKAGLPIPKTITADRRRKIEARIREHGPEAWAEACRRMASSPFCRGDNDRGWRADLDFLCQTKSFNGLIEGRYDARAPQPRSKPPPVLTPFQQRHQTATDAFDRRLGKSDDDEPSRYDFELEPGNWRAH